jgi:uncharacterized glyoxalase superfamily protein PhnB
MNILNSREPVQARDSDLKNSVLANVSLAGSSFDNVNLRGSAFDNVNLTEVTFNNVDLSRVCITSANTTGMTINGLPVPAAGAFSSVMQVLRVTDMQRAIDWYTKVIGLALLWRSADDGGGENCMLQSGPVTLMLSTGTHLGGKPAFTGTLYFNMRDVAAFHDGIKDRAEFVWPLQKMDYGTVEFGIRDPDGYTLAFAQAVR